MTKEKKGYTTGMPEWVWPEWRKAKPGTRIRHIGSGATGTFVKPSKSKNNGAIIDWDPVTVGAVTMPARRGYVVSPARDLEPVT